MDTILKKLIPLHMKEYHDTEKNWKGEDSGNLKAIGGHAYRQDTALHVPVEVVSES